MARRMAIGRKRARATADTPRSLQEDVLCLIRQCKPAFLAQRATLIASYDTAWSAYCRANADASSPSWTDEPAREDALARSLARLIAAMRCVDASSTVLLQVVARSAVASVSVANARRRKLLVKWIWTGHTCALWRLEDVLLHASSHCNGQDGHDTAWLCDPLRDFIVAPSSDREPSIGQDIVAYLLRIAFPDVAPAFASRESAALARHSLNLLCGTNAESSTISLPCLAALFRLAADHLKTMQCDGATAASLRVLLQDQVMFAVLAEPACLQHNGYERGALLDMICVHLQACLPTADALALFRQAGVELARREAEVVAPRGGNCLDDRADTLNTMLAACARRDATFLAQGLASAHDIAQNAISASDPSLLRQCLDLTATLADATDDETIYPEWFRCHFAAAEAQFPASTPPEKPRGRHSSSPPATECTFVCLRSPAPSQERTSPPLSSSCALLGSNSKRNLQFVCAFLLEFNRSEQPRRRRAHHVYAHLSAIKTHHTLSGSAVTGLLADFCSQTRARHAELRIEELEASVAQRQREKGHSGDPIRSQQSALDARYAAGTRSIVGELIDMYLHDRASLARQVKQWKLFKAQEWKQQILPCCLDLDYWCESQQVVSRVVRGCDFEDRDQSNAERYKTVVNVVGLAQTLARHHAIGTQEYVTFVERAEAWLAAHQQPARSAASISKRLPRGESISALRETVNRHLAVSVTIDRSQLRAFESTWDSATAAFVIAFEELVELRDDAQRKQMREIWEQVVTRTSTHAATAASIEEDARGPVIDAVERHLSLWIQLLSSVNADATPEDRMRVMDSYCQFAVAMVQDLALGASTAPSELIQIAHFGSLLGLLASLPICEAIAMSWSRQLELALVVDDPNEQRARNSGEIRRLGSFLSGFLLGFVKNPTDRPEQEVLQVVLSARMREFVVWLSHHTRTWWLRHSAANSDRFWNFVAQVLDPLLGRGWFRLVYSPGVLSTSDQWQRFIELELHCCASDVLSGVGALCNDLAFANREHNAIEELVLQNSSSARSHGVQPFDVCRWIAHATLSIAASTQPETHRGSQGLILLFKDVWMRRGELDDLIAEMATKVMEGVVKECGDNSTVNGSNCSHVLQCGLDLLGVITSSVNGAWPPLNLPRYAVKPFLESAAACVTNADPSLMSFEWTQLLFRIATSVREPKLTADEIPGVVFMHWASDFRRISRHRQAPKNGKSIYDSVLVQRVQVCHDFFVSLGVNGVTQAFASLMTASQPVQSSNLSDHVRDQVRSLRWLIVSSMLRMPRVGGGPGYNVTLTSTLAIHQIAVRVLQSSAESCAGVSLDQIATKIVESCRCNWVQEVSGQDASSPSKLRPPTACFGHQLLLLHIVAELASRFPPVGRFLLRSSTELKQDRVQALFVLMTLSVANETESLNTILSYNGSLWVNGFAEVASSLADHQNLASDDASAPHSLATLLLPLTSVQAELTRVLQRVLSFAASNQVDLLDGSVATQLEQRFPSLTPTLRQIPVLSFDSASYLTA